MAAANGGASRRSRPNMLVTGTPGTGKTTTCSLLSEAAGLRHVNIGDLVREKSLHDGWDDDLECHVINEDLTYILALQQGSPGTGFISTWDVCPCLTDAGIQEDLIHYHVQHSRKNHLILIVDGALLLD